MKNLFFFILFILIIPIIGFCLPNPNSNTYSTSSPLTIQIDYNGTSNPVYVGRAAAGAVTTDAMWQIEKITYDGNGNALTVQWSPNYNTFGDFWASHATLTYS